MTVNWAMITAIAAVFGPISSLAVGAYVYGKLTQSVVDTKEDVRELSLNQKEDRKTLSEHGEAIAGLQARPRYVNGSGH